MTNEAVNPIVLRGTNKGGVKRYSCADCNAIPKGTLLFLSTINANTVSGANLVAHTGRAAGIASTEKKAADGQTTIGVWTLGKFDLYADSSDGITAGALLAISGANMVENATPDDILSGMVIARAVENQTVGTADTIQCELVMI